MKICYVDESGGVEVFGSRPDSTPLMVIGGVILDHSVLHPIMKDYLALKRRFFPRRFPPRKHSLDCMQDEVKGADIRTAVRGGRQKSRQAVTFIGEILALLQRYDARVVGRVWVKEPGRAMDPHGSYTYSIQDICRHFHHLLDRDSDLGLIVCDGREHAQDAEVAHSIFTQKHQSGGDAFPRLIETPTFGRSVSHVGLQLADLLVAGVVFPMAACAYCPTYVSSLRNGTNLNGIGALHGAAVKEMRHVYIDGAGATRGGIVVSDKVNKRPSGWLFSNSEATSSCRIVGSPPAPH